MVNGSSSGRSPAQDWASNSRLARSRWRMWLHRKLRTNVVRVGTTWRISQVNVAVHQLSQSQMVGQGNGQKQPRVGHQAVIVEGHMDAVEALRGYHPLGALSFRAVFFVKNHYP